MIERALQPVRNQGEVIPPTLPDTRDSVSAFEQVRKQRSNSGKEAENKASSFSIEKNFSSSSKVLAQTLGRFNKVLNYLETPPESHETDAASETFTLPDNIRLTPADPEPTRGQSANNSSHPGEIKVPTPPLNPDEEGYQYELDLIPNEHKQINKQSALPSQQAAGQNEKPPLELKTFDDLTTKSLNIEQVPQIDIGINPSDFKIHNIITDEIIKAISHSGPELDIKPIGEHIASKLANIVRKQLANQPHAIATTKEAAPIQTMDRLI